MPQEKRCFLLVTGQEDDTWRSHAEKTLAHLGSIEVVDEVSAVERSCVAPYVAIIVDAAYVKTSTLLVARIRGQVSDARVIVVTASPTWKRARDAFNAGATDYVERSLDSSDLLASVEAALAKPLTPWPR